MHVMSEALHWLNVELKNILTFPSEEVPATCPVAMVILSGWTAKLMKTRRIDILDSFF